MKITFSPAAIERLTSELSGQSSRLKLLYDTEGCGCVMNGVPTLLRIEQPEEGDVKAVSSPYEIWYEKRYEVFFEDELKVDYRPGTPSFILRSDNQTYTTHLLLLK
ncbi:hypothetical protein BG53_14040 [Paenibacillus darwinianus]|uniref:Core domain-containing protein n=1 Tax=Paenibacillus darwinianus TaxID=1380763 RepID=A0A9W5W864_9BACL|nr:iron-sulfur cluster biosynthesis family protein [Paenibacillus darwinianus]EXX89781.1 hypothetical protein BG52_14805 [Paenibacillus darwinianus]EXX90145.1 hypothetical protein BG53_14040 [Paenibacillus darwinianus]EXX90511.1 hypothetical protein CH50_15160 [Paenibacillus darwinianus]